jgi:hypothetical protein
MIEAIKALQEMDYYGGGEFIELAKGKHEYVTTWRGFKRKIKRLWLSKKQ